MEQLQDMTRAELRRAAARADRELTRCLDSLIAAGRGHERPTEIRQRSDDLSLRWIAAADVCRALESERRRRLDYHGTEHRIR